MHWGDPAHLRPKDLKIKLVASDMDGTLLNDSGEIGEAFFEIFDELDRKGIMFVACSGRFYATMVRNFSRLEQGLILVAHNGAVIRRSNSQQAMFESDIDDQLVRHILTGLQELDLEAEIYLSARDTAYVINPSQALKDKLFKTDVDFMEVTSFEAVNEGIKKIGIFQGGGLTEPVIKQVKQTVAGLLECVVSGETWLDIMNMNVNKGTALKLIQDRFRITMEETMAFGDYYNDIPLFQKAKYSFAMNNAPFEVKKAAGFIAPDNNSQGVITVIKKLLFEDPGFSYIDNKNNLCF